MAGIFCTLSAREKTSCHKRQRRAARHGPPIACGCVACHALCQCPPPSIIPSCPAHCTHASSSLLAARVVTQAVTQAVYHVSCIMYHAWSGPPRRVVYFRSRRTPCLRSLACTCCRSLRSQGALSPLARQSAISKPSILKFASILIPASIASSRAIARDCVRFCHALSL